jgi:hypothetical protein
MSTHLRITLRKLYDVNFHLQILQPLRPGFQYRPGRLYSGQPIGSTLFEKNMRMDISSSISSLKTTIKVALSGRDYDTILPFANVATAVKNHPEPVSTSETLRVSCSFLKSVLTVDTSGTPFPEQKQTTDSGDGKSSCSRYRANGLRNLAENAQSEYAFFKTTKEQQDSFYTVCGSVGTLRIFGTPCKPHSISSIISLLARSVCMYVWPL